LFFENYTMLMNLGKAEKHHSLIRAD